MLCLPKYAILYLVTYKQPATMVCFLLDMKGLLLWCEKEGNWKPARLFTSIGCGLCEQVCEEEPLSRVGAAL